MINPRLTSTTLSASFLRLLLAAVLLAACAPAASTATRAQPVLTHPTATVPPSLPTLDSSDQVTLAPTEAVAPTALPIATSRGPNLEATDPSTVKLASGGLQLIEFFEFW